MGDDVSDHDGDGEGSDGESCHDDDTTVALGSPSPNLSCDEEGAADEDGADNHKSMDEEKEFIDKRPMEASPLEMDDASSTESAMSPGDVTGFGGDIGGCDESESDFEFETDNESTSPWEKTGDSQMYKAMRRAYLAEGKDWPPTWDDGRPDFEAYRAAHTTPAKRSHPVPSESGIKPTKAPKIEASQQDKMDVTWQRRSGLRDGKTLISKLNFHYDDQTIHHTWTIPFTYRLTQHKSLAFVLAL